MADIVKMDGKHAARKVSEDVVDVLEAWLARAKSGDITGLAIAGVGHDGSTWTQHTQIDNFTQLAGIVSILQFDLRNSVVNDD